MARCVLVFLPRGRTVQSLCAGRQNVVSQAPWGLKHLECRHTSAVSKSTEIILAA